MFPITTTTTLLENLKDTEYLIKETRVLINTYPTSACLKMDLAQLCARRTDIELEIDKRERSR